MRDDHANVQRMTRGLRQSDRLSRVQAPIIPVVADLIRAHPGTISLGQGVVHYGPPPQAIEAIAGFLAQAENHKYKPVAGIPELLSAIRTKLATDNHIRIDESNRVMVTAGGNMAFMNAVQAIADPGDEVIIQRPFYFNHEMAIAISDAVPVLVRTSAEGQLDVDAITAAITPRTRAVVTVSPNNPSGAVHSQAALQRVNELCRKRGIYHIHDEAYEYFTYGSARHFSPASAPDSAGHTISLFSLSKSFGMASWRIGYMVFPTHLEDAIRKIQDTNLICAPAISQYAAVGALAAGATYCRQNIASIAPVRELVLEELSKVGAFCEVPQAEGAFYFLLRLHTKQRDMAMVERLVRDFGVAVIPGCTFGIDDECRLRVAYGSLQRETVAEGVGRLVKGLRAIAGE